MNHWISTYYILLYVIVFTLKSTNSFLLPEGLTKLGNGKCRYSIKYESPTVERYTTTERCNYYERCYVRAVQKTRTKTETKTHDLNFCCSGYKTVHEGTSGSTDDFSCLAICEPPCIHGQCTAPGECECLPGFEKGVPAHVCQPSCTPGCVNATCIDANKCECFPGFSKTKLANTCEPHCTHGCHHGTCTAPETCSCDTGYTLSTSNKSLCEPICSLECENGFCSAPEQCTCNEGYTEYDWNLCVPYCSTPCVNGNCMAPEVCTCWEGYIKNSTSSTCEPQCSKECIHGECIAPDLCSCNDGFEMDEETSTCLPICSEGCENGVCTAPEKCVCNTGFWNNNGTCAPSCDTDCINGNCTSPNECSCNEGTLKSSWFHCISTCDSSQHDCHNYTTSTLPSTKYALNTQESYVVLTELPSMLTLVVPCIVARAFQSEPSVQNYQCFTEVHFQESSMLSVCTLENDHTWFNETETRRQKALNLTALEIKFLNMTIVHPEQAELCPGYLCSDSNRTLVLNEMSHLSICLHHPKTSSNEEGLNLRLIIGATLIVIVGGMIAVLLISRRELWMWTAYTGFGTHYVVVSEATRPSDEGNSQQRLCLNPEEDGSGIGDDSL